ncbi:MAG: hypothetical protein ACLF0G_17520 [Candidatus Brocadiia bacterium]
MYSEEYPSNPPTIETDAESNIYLVYPDIPGEKTRFLRFTPANGYAKPVVVKAYPQAYSAAKFASTYDPRRERLYHATQWGHVLTFHPSGRLLRSQQVFTGGRQAGPSYPHLFVDEFGVVHYAMTTRDGDDPKLPNDGKDDIPYETIRYLMSVDGGRTWRAMGGRRVSIPTACDPDGPSTMINLPDEVVYKTWLGCMHAKNGKVHFTYLAQNPQSPEKLGNPPKIHQRQHYTRFDARTGQREIDSWSDWGRWGGRSLHIHTVGGLITSYPSDPTGPLFAVGGQGWDGMKEGARKLVALVSYDNGSTWEDYAASCDVGLVWAESGSRAVTRDGKVIGALACARPQWATTHFFQFDARPALLGPGFGDVRLPRPSELDGPLKTAYVHMGRGRYNDAVAKLRPLPDELEGTEGEERRTARVIMALVERRVAATIERLERLEKIGDYYALRAELSAQSRNLRGLPSFDEKHQRWQAERSNETWRRGIEAGRDYRAIHRSMRAAGDRATPSIIKRLEELAAQCPDSPYGRAAAGAAARLEAAPEASASALRQAYHKQLMAR